MTVRHIPAREVLTLARRSVQVDLSLEYAEIGIRSFGRGVFHKPAISGADLGGKRVYEIHEGDLVISNVFAWEGAVTVAGPAENGRIGSHRFMTWVVRPGLGDASYLHHYLLSERGLEQLQRASPGSAGRNRTLAIGAFEDLVIPLPGIGEQRAIAAYLDRHEGAARQVLSAVRSAAILRGLRERVVRDIQEAPRSSLGDLLTPARDWTVPVAGQSYQPIGVRGFGRGLIRYPATDIDGLSKMRYYHVPGSALIISNIKAWEGAVAMSLESDSSLIASNRFLCYQAKTGAINLEYVHRFLLSGDGIASLNRASPGSADRNRTLSIASFEAIRIPVPPRSVQDRLVRTASQLDRLERLSEHRSTLARALPQAARNEVFSTLV